MPVLLAGHTTHTSMHSFLTHTSTKMQHTYLTPNVHTTTAGPPSKPEHRPSSACAQLFFNTNTSRSPHTQLLHTQPLQTARHCEAAGACVHTTQEKIVHDTPHCRHHHRYKTLGQNCKPKLPQSSPDSRVDLSSWGTGQQPDTAHQQLGSVSVARGPGTAERHLR